MTREMLLAMATAASARAKYHLDAAKLRNTPQGQNAELIVADLFNGLTIIFNAGLEAQLQLNKPEEGK